MSLMASQITSLTPFIQAQIKENIKAPRHWPLCGEFTDDGEFPAQKASNAENVSIWWRHHGLVQPRRYLSAPALQSRLFKGKHWYMIIAILVF